MFPDWDAISAIGQMLGALGVILSLLYLAVQVRADARERRATTIHQQTLIHTNVIHALMDGEFADIWLRGLRDVDSLNPKDRLRLAAFFSLLFRVIEDDFMQAKIGLLDPAVWEARRAPLALLRQPTVRAWWAARSSSFSKEFCAFVETQVAEGNLPEVAIMATVDPWTPAPVSPVSPTSAAAPTAGAQVEGAGS